MSDTAVVILGAVGAFLGAVITLAVTWLKARDKIQQRRDDSALGPLRDALDMRAKDCDRLSVQVSRLIESNEQLIAENADCYVDMGHLYAWAEQADHALRKQCGPEVAAAMSVLPPRKERPRRAEFAARTAQQAAILVQASSGSSLPGTGGGI